MVNVIAICAMGSPQNMELTSKTDRLRLNFGRPIVPALRIAPFSTPDTLAAQHSRTLFGVNLPSTKGPGAVGSWSWRPPRRGQHYSHAAACRRGVQSGDYNLNMPVSNRALNISSALANPLNSLLYSSSNLKPTSTNLLMLMKNAYCTVGAASPAESRFLST